MADPNLPPHVNQFVDARGIAWPKVSVHGGPLKDYTHVMCGDATAAAGYGHHFRAAKAIDPTVIRQVSGHATNRDGLSAREVVAALAAEGVKAILRIVMTGRFAAIMATPGVWVCLLVDDDTFNGCDQSYLGDHWIGLPSGVSRPHAGETAWAAYDPTCPRKDDADVLPPGVNWESSTNILNAGRKWSRQHGYGARLTCVTIRQLPASLPVDPDKARIAELEREVAALGDEIDGRDAAIAVAAAALSPFVEAR